jgi:hypothetical protein
VPDFEDGTADVLKRKLNVRFPTIRMTQEEQEILHSEFERISTKGKLD